MTEAYLVGGCQATCPPNGLAITRAASTTHFACVNRCCLRTRRCRSGVGVHCQALCQDWPGRGLGPESDPEESDPLSRDQPWLAGLYAASVSGRTAFGPDAGRRTTRTGDQIDPESMDAVASPRCTSVNGFSLHANVALSGADRNRLERLTRLCGSPHKRYCARPLVAVGTTRSSARRSRPLPPETRLAEWDDACRFSAPGTPRETLGVNPCSQSSLGEIFRRVRSGIPKSHIPPSWRFLPDLKPWTWSSPP